MLPARHSWDRLLSDRRIGKPDAPATTEAHRTAFEIDRDRITFAEATRTLEGKRQVHGKLLGNDCVRSRLTHSQEVASIARSIGVIIGEGVNAREPALDRTPADFGHVLAAAAAAHDIGHGPFAHSAEQVVSDWWTSSPIARTITAGIPRTLVRELTHWEGNAQGFRALTHLEGWQPTGGLQLTAATLGVYTKYPRGIDTFGADADGRRHLKYGYFASEAALFCEVVDTCGLLPLADGVWARHPLTYALECADDCFLITDTEDGFAVGILSLKETEDLLMPIADPPLDEYAAITSPRKRAIYLRAKAIGRHVALTGEAFFRHYDDIMAGAFQDSLLDRLPHAAHLRHVRAVSDARLYHYAGRVREDLQADKVLRTLLDAYAQCLLDREHAVKHGHPMPHRSDCLIRLLPEPDSFSLDRSVWVRQLMDWLISLTDASAMAAATIAAP